MISHCNCGTEAILISFDQDEHSNGDVHTSLHGFSLFFAEVEIYFKSVHELLLFYQSDDSPGNHRPF